MSLQHGFPTGYVQSATSHPVRLHTEYQSYGWETDNQPLLDLLENVNGVDARVSTIETNLGAFVANGSLTADLDFGGNKATNLADPTSIHDAVSLNYLNTVFIDASYAHIAGNEEITGSKIFNSPILGQLTGANAIAHKISSRYDALVAADEKRACVISVGTITNYDIDQDPALPIILDSNFIKIGAGSDDSNISLIFRNDNTSATNPGIRYNNSSSHIEYSNDGSVWIEMDTIVTDALALHKATNETITGSKLFSTPILGYADLTHDVAFKISGNNPGSGTPLTRLMVETGTLNGYDLADSEQLRNTIALDLCPINVRLGRSVAEDIYLKFRNGTSDTLPGFRFNNSTSLLQWSNNGTSWYNLLTWNQCVSVNTGSQYSGTFDSADSAADRATKLNDQKAIINALVVIVNDMISKLKTAGIMA